MAVSTFWVAEPHGTCGAHTTTLMPGLVRSRKVLICLGFPGETAIVRVLEAKFTGWPVSSPAADALSMFLVSAEANTSAWAPWVSWVTRSEDPAKENSTDAPGFCLPNSSPIWVKVFFSDAAANTMTFTPAALEDGADDFCSVLHAGSATSATLMARAGRTRFTTNLRAFRR